MARIGKQDFNKMVKESTYFGHRGDYMPTQARRTLRQFWAKNTGLAERGMDRKTALNKFRKIVGDIKGKGVRMRYSQVGGKLPSTQNLKTRRTVAGKLKDIRKEQNKLPEETEGLSKEQLRAIHLRQRMEELDEMDKASGAKREALDKPIISISNRTNKTDKPVASISQHQESEPPDMVID